MTIAQTSRLSLCVLLLWLQAETGAGPPATTAAAKRPFRELSSAEMKQEIRTGVTMEGMQPEGRKFAEKMQIAMYKSRLLAEGYFEVAGEARKKLSGPENARAVRDVAYNIVQTLKLDPRMEELRPGEEVDMAWLLKQMQGTYDGIFRVRPRDGGALEQYRIAFEIGLDGERRIGNIEKDPTFDEREYLDAKEKAKVVAWVETALKGKRDSVLSHFPKGEYAYLSSPVIDGAWVDLERLAPSSRPSASQDATAWTGVIFLYHTLKGCEFEVADRLAVVIEKKGDAFAITRCDRDVAFYRAMEEKVRAATFITKYVSQPDQRAKWLVQGGADQLPQSATVVLDAKRLALQLNERKRLRGDLPFVEGDPGKGLILEAVCSVKTGEKSERFRFDVLSTDDNDKPFIMLEVASKRH